MPITLGCPSCGKRFRARDESAGKRVKCPYCGAPVSVPTSQESAVASAPTDAIPAPASKPVPPAPPPGRPVPPPAPAPVATTADWGAKPAESSPPNPFGGDATKSAGRPASPKPAAKPAARPFPGSPAGSETPEQLAAQAWRKSRRGLGWVLFGLFFLALPGFAEFGKEVYFRSTGNPLPSGPGADWVSIEGYINSGGKSVELSKGELINVGCYGIPVAFAGLFLFLGRLRASAAPRSSGAKGLFLLSGLFTLVAFVGLGAAVVCAKMADTPDFPARQVAVYGELAFLICGLTAEFWFLIGLTASGLSLKRPKVARAVGLIGFVTALAVALMTVGWEIYVREFRAVTPDSRFYELMAFMIGWLLLVGVYCRAVSSTRVAIRDYLETVEE
jgi:hypothetical protein